MDLRGFQHFQHVIFIGFFGIFLSLGSLASPEFQCRLEVTNKNTGKITGVCSGTFLSNTRFLTAGHCFNILDSGPKPNQTANYQISCGTAPTVKVKAVAHHPFFFKNSSAYFAPKEEINPSSGSYQMNDHNDIAIALTEPVALSIFPKTIPLNFNIGIQKHSCQMRAFSPKYCGGRYGSSCYRTNFSLKPIFDFGIDSFCDLKTGDGCSLSKEMNESSSEERPLMLELKGPYNSTPSVGHGDSGGGLLCNIDGDTFLTGIYVTAWAPQVVNLQSKQGFIKKFVSISENQFLKAALTFNINPDYKKILSHQEDINFRLKNLLHKSNDTTVSNFTAIDLKFLNEFKEWVVRNPKKAHHYLHQFNVRKIVPENSTIDFSHPTAGKFQLEHSMVDSGQVLKIPRKTTLSDLLIFLNSHRK